MEDAYKKSGVDIELADSIINKVKPMIQDTHIPGVIGGIGNFAGLFSLSQEKVGEPVLVSGTDGVGTKLIIANLLEKHDTVGIDLVAMCVNDILTCGAKPIFFLDYIATGKLNENKIINVIKGIVEGCKTAGCALLGGETAEMPGFYEKGEYDLSGFAVGIVDRSKLITGERIKPGDILIGLASSGLHSNGFSLVRKVLLGKGTESTNKKIKLANQTVSDLLIEPTRIYVPSVLPLLKKYDIKGIVHITGGGFYGNIPRILPKNTSVNIYPEKWPQLNIFKLIKEQGRLNDKEMFNTFNMGIGLIIFIDREDKNNILQDLEKAGEPAYCIGEVISEEDSMQKVFIHKT